MPVLKDPEVEKMNDKRRWSSSYVRWQPFHYWKWQQELSLTSTTRYSIDKNLQSHRRWAKRIIRCAWKMYFSELLDTVHRERAVWQQFPRTFKLGHKNFTAVFAALRWTSRDTSQNTNLAFFTSEYKWFLRSVPGKSLSPIFSRAGLVCDKSSYVFPMHLYDWVFAVKMHTSGICHRSDSKQVWLSVCRFDLRTFSFT